MVFGFRDNYSAPVDPQTVGERLEAIRESNDGIITPAAVVDDARPKDAPLHPCFEWNNRAAAEAYREDQARRLIRSIEVVREDAPDEEPHIAFVSVGQPYKSGPAYTATREALSDDRCRAMVMDQCLRQLRGLQNRYSEFREIAEAIRAAIEQIEMVPA